MNAHRRTLSWAAAVAAVFAVTATALPAAGAPPASRPAEAAAVAAPAGAEQPVTETARPKHRAKHPKAGVAYHALWGERTNADRRAMFDRLRRIGVKWVRIGFPWALAQPNQPTGSDPGWHKWGLDRVDAVVRMAHRRGMDVSFTFVGTPGWANGGKGPRYLPDDPGDYARAIQWLAHRYRGRVQSWEIWNEVSGGQYIQGASMAEYVKLLCRAYPAVHRGSPKAKVISAGTGGIPDDWIRQFYATGAKKCFDVLAIHPYISDQSPREAWGDRLPVWLTKMHRVRSIMRAHGDRRTRVWFTEFGWNTGSPSVGGVSGEKQGRYLVEMFKMTDRRLPYVTRMAYYMAKDEEPTGRSQSDYGLYTFDMHPKPAVGIYRNYLKDRR